MSVVVLDAPPGPDAGPRVLLASDAWLAQIAGAAPSDGVVVRFGEAVDLSLPVVRIPEEADGAAIVELLRAAAQLARERSDADAVRRRAEAAESRVSALNRVGIALSAERDRAALLALIVSEARRFTGSEAGSLYLLDEAGQTLTFVEGQCAPVEFDFEESTIPVTGDSIAGHVALSGEVVHLDDAYRVPEDAGYAFNSGFDRATGFRTRAMVAVPMRDHEGRTVGVLQLMNPLSADGIPMTYADDLVPLLESLATQAAVSVRATQLTESLRVLFDDFASAAVAAIEMRDPTTAGHSHRVAEFSVVLAGAVDRTDNAELAQHRFSRQEVDELRYAALLHDVGKIGVPERVLVKAKKLEDYQLESIRDRFAYARDVDDDAALRVLRERMREGRPPSAGDIEELEAEQARRTAEFARVWEALVAANEPTVLAEETGAALGELTSRTFVHPDRGEIPLLTTEEFELLSIPRGSLSEVERRQIESHVTHTFTFLSKIPWTPGLRRIPEIAAAHHEKLNGRGYPMGLDEPQIPIQARILAVCDIFDALTASDRPYKKALPVDRSLAILEDEARSGVLDEAVVRVFLELVRNGHVVTRA